MSSVGSDLWSEIKHAVTSLAREPALAATIVSMLAVGIAGTTGVFSVFNALFVRPLPFPEPERLMNLDETAPEWNLDFVSIAYPDFHAWREQNRTFEAMAVYDGVSMNLSLQGEAQRVEAAQVSHDVASVLRLEPVLGRHVTPEEDRPGGAKVVLLGYALWQRQFGGKAEAVGQALRLDGESYTVIGVLPPEAVFIGNADLWIPLATDVAQRTGSWYLSGIGRLKPGVTRAQAIEDLTRIHKALADTRTENRATSPVVLPVLDRLLGEYRLGTSALLGGVGLVLLIACGNTAGLLLARSFGRAREIGIRQALGASRRRILRQLMTESVVLAAAGGLLGVALGHWALSSVVATMPDEIPRWVRFELDTRFLVFALLATLTSALISGLAPAFQASKSDIQSTLSSAGGRASLSPGRRRALGALVVIEVALALVLLVCAGLLVEGFRQIRRVDPGFRPENTLIYRLSLPDAKYGKDEQQVAFFEQHLDEIRALPGVESGGAVSHEPLGGHSGYFFAAEGAAPRAPGEKNPVVLTLATLPHYLETMGITLVSGRFFDAADGRSEDNQVAIVNESFARHFWPGQDPVGRRIRYSWQSSKWMTVVGVTRDVKHYGLTTEMRPSVYQPHRQLSTSSMSMVLHTKVDPLSIVAAVRERVRRADPDLPLYQIATMSRRLEDSLWSRKASVWLASAFATVALLLAVGGIYGVLSYAVKQRTREIGIRMALGARQGHVVRQVLGQGLRLVALGATLGLAGAFWTARLLASTLFGVRPDDVWIYATVTALLLAVALLANWIPARRAARVHPVEALRVG